MQKILNLLFILILVAISTNIPLNTALLDIHVMKPIVQNPEHDVEVPAVEQISLIGMQYALLANPSEETGQNADRQRDPSHWTDSNPRNHLIAIVKNGTVEYPAKDSEQHEMCFRFILSSNTGHFSGEFPELTLRVDGTAVRLLENAEISEASTAEIHVSPDPFTKYALAKYNMESLFSGLSDGYHYATLLCEEHEIGNILFAKNTAISKTLLPIATEIPPDQKVISVFIPDLSYETVLPIGRFYPAAFYDFVALYQTLIRGGKEELGLKSNPAVANSSYYWIADGAARVDYKSKNLTNISHPDRMYEAVAYTFAQLGKLKKADIYLDGKLLKSIPTPNPPFYYFVRDIGKNHLFIVYESAEKEDIGASELINGFIRKMHTENILPPTVKLVNCEYKKETGILSVDLLEYEQNENPHLFEPLLSLTAHSLKDVKEVHLNGKKLKKIEAFNLENER